MYQKKNLVIYVTNQESKVLQRTKVLEGIKYFRGVKVLEGQKYFREIKVHEGEKVN